MATRIAISLTLAIITGLGLVAYFVLRHVPPLLELDGIGVTGRVLDASSTHDYPNRRIAGALVEAYDLAPDSRQLLAHTTTDAWGRYALPIPKPAKIRILVSQLPDFEKEQADLEVTDRHTFDFTLLPRDRHIAGHVRTESGAPVARAKVQTEEIRERIVETDEQGAFRLDHLAAKSYRLRVEIARLTPREGYVFYPIDGGRDDVDLTLPDPESPADDVPHLAAGDGPTGKPAPPLALRGAIPHGSVPALGPEVTLLHFFAGWNLASREHLHELSVAAKTRGFHYLPIHHASAEPASLERFLASLGVDVPIGIDALDREAPLGSRTFARYGVSRLPTYVVIRADGVVAAAPRAKSVDEILAAIETAKQR